MPEPVPTRSGRRATYADLMEVPDTKVAEIIDGELVVTPRPGSPHAHAAGLITGKMRIYAREGVSHLWLVEPLLRTLEVYRLETGRWIVLATHAGDDVVRAEPFDAVPTALGRWWLPVEGSRV